MPRANVKKLSFFLQVVTQTKMAWIVNDGSADNIVLPKSQVSVVGAVNTYGQATFLVPEWLARQKGLWD